jgi:SAM-dependent methyltransferase
MSRDPAAEMAERTTRDNNGHIFRRCGIAALSDLKNEHWINTFAQLEKIQSDFLAKEAEFRSSDYKWPKDTLHNWSRAWEYCYVYDFLCNLKAELGSAPVVADIGSGVTFFPTAVARLGYAVVCSDIDPLCARDLPRVADAVHHKPGALSFRLTDGMALPFQNEEVDAVYCISVLEHIPSFEETIGEMARILKSRGMLILTVDLDLNGKHDIGVDGYLALRRALERYFDFAAPEITVHPVDQLTTANSPYPLRIFKGIERLWFNGKQFIKPVFGRRPSALLDYELTVAGFVLQRY